MRKIAAALLAMLFCGPLCAGMSYDVSAKVSVSGAVEGDIDGNYLVDRGDVALLQKWLLSDMQGWRLDMTAGDLNNDRRLDAADLTLLKRRILENAAVTLIEPPIRVLEPSLPSVGVSRIPVFAVCFPDKDEDEDDLYTFSVKDEELLKERCFGESDPRHPDYPMESISAYYARASYGRMHLTGDVYSYTALHPISHYTVDHAQSLLDEIMAAFDEQLDYQMYDADRNKVIDSVMIVLPEDVIEIDSNSDGKPDWWPFSGNSVSQARFDGLRVGKYCVIAFDSYDTEDFTRKAAHELGHALGLPDYYCYTPDAFGETEGLKGVAGDELMDEGEGDLSAFSKLMLGWFAEDEIQIYTGGTQTFDLTSLQCGPSCLLIPREPDAGFLSEYFLLEYNTKDANTPAYGHEGVRILHVQAEVSEGKRGMEFKYYNNGQHYDQSNEKQRVLRLVNENGMYYPGLMGVYYADSVDGSLESFHWYDENGDLTAETGLKIKITGPFYDHTEQPEWSSGSQIPGGLRGDYKITVSEAG